MSTEDILETFHFHVLKRFLSVSVKLSAMFLRRLKNVSGLLGSDGARKKSQMRYEHTAAAAAAAAAHFDITGLGWRTQLGH